ncbi:MAG: serine/threonine protein kinase [Deltaproteobacteria bacterium]|nr:serine/threonine protein kinase [Deltaproteobacteria bacterium]
MAKPPCPRCLLEAPLPDATLGDRFVLEEELGKGGMGVVFAAKDTRIDRRVALKLIDRSGNLDALLQEARSLGKLSHPNIVTLYEAGVEGGQVYLAMELVDGSSLRQRGRLFPRALASVALQLCGALEYAHEHGVIHRDIKPDNVLIDRHGCVKLSDFGIAKIIGAAPSAETRQGLLAGSQGYVAPELLRGAPPSSLTDIYAVGVLMYELLAGELPAGNAAPLAWPLDGVVRRAMAQDPSARFQSVRELRAALELACRAIEADALPPDEQNWLRAVALLFAAASGLALWALLQSISPIIVDGENVYPLARMQLRRLADGRLVSFARLEIGSSLVALAAFAIAFAAFGALRRHWQQAGLNESRPDRPLEESRTVFLLGLGAVAIFLVRRALLAFGLDAWALYIPVFGGALELWILYVVWCGLLEAARRSRPVTKEWLLWTGFWLALVPPALELLTYILGLERATGG